MFLLPLRREYSFVLFFFFTPIGRPVFCIHWELFHSLMKYNFSYSENLATKVKKWNVFSKIYISFNDLESICQWWNTTQCKITNMLIIYCAIAWQSVYNKYHRQIGIHCPIYIHMYLCLHVFTCTVRIQSVWESFSHMYCFIYYSFHHRSQSTGQ